MAEGFPNPIKVKESKTLNSPWNFDAPHYDERSSCYVNAGSHHGVGYAQKVGHEQDPKRKTNFLPEHSVHTMKVASTPHRNLRLEIEE